MLTEEMLYPVIPGECHASALDPLVVDGLLPTVWKMNAAADVGELVRLLRGLVPAEDFAAQQPLQDCVAAMRDLGLLLGSIKRCGVQPMQAVPELETRLLRLAERTGMVPRDTIFHYVAWNPVGPRERTYTGERMESILISSVRLTLPRLAAAVEQCRRLEGLEPAESNFAIATQELARLLRSLEEAIDIVFDNVTPEFFAQTMRPYFEAVHVGGVDYLGPAAAHVPLSLIDLVLWASDYGSDSYEEFCRESAQYSIPSWQSLYKRWATGPSIVSRVTSALALAVGDPLPPYLRASAKALCDALQALVVFRGKHLTVARRAYAKEIGLYSVGSGGGTLQLLKEVTTLTRGNANSVRMSFAGNTSRRRAAENHCQ
jgi:monodechloroaminopyrrolnitrin synthase